jgi:hypothetical protein
MKKGEGIQNASKFGDVIYGRTPSQAVFLHSLILWTIETTVETILLAHYPFLPVPCEELAEYSTQSSPLYHPTIFYVFLFFQPLQASAIHFSYY